MVGNKVEEVGLTEEEKDILRELKDSLTDFLDNSLLKIVLFGSKARGDYDEQSDIDLAVIVQRLTREKKRDILDIVADLEIKYLIILSVIVFSEEEFNRLKQQERRLVLDIEKEGIIL
ncbi:MAG: nucleotidyltransferase domain-containing protein [bacterium]